MSDITVWPDEVVVHFEKPANVLEALVGAQVPIAHLCGGNARCSTCRVRVLDGLGRLSERTEKEEAMASKLDFPETIRLACQTTASGSVRVGRLVLDSLDAEMASQLGKGSFAGPAGREVSAAVMFTDVVGYTAIADALPAYDIVHLLNRFFTRASSVVEANSGRVDNYMGDGVLALFGVDGQPEAALSAVSSGLGVLEVAGDIARYVDRIYGLSFGVRVGIDYGEVVFGLMGAESSARETVIGDTVNVASRLEAANKETGTELLVTDAVYQATQGRVLYGRRFELDLKGKTGRVVGHEVVGLAAG